MEKTVDDTFESTGFLDPEAEAEAAPEAWAEEESQAWDDPEAEAVPQGAVVVPAKNTMPNAEYRSHVLHLAEAAHFLVELHEADATRFARLLSELYPIARAYSMALTDPQYVVLNPLLALMKDHAQFTGIMKLIGGKRKDRIFASVTARYQTTDRRDIAAENMRAERVRLRIAVDLENAKRSESQQLRGQSRKVFEQRLLRKWRDARVKVVKDARASSGGILSHQKRRAVTDAFWNEIDGALALAERKLLGG